ncbi:MAG: CHRD domain-containing protein [Novosphingobium sp.]|nr:CHRD domain-containing protein [Novosphingobium sp.]
MRNLMLLASGLAMSLSGVANASAVELTATLSGANETKPGDPDGSGSFTAEVDIGTGDVCYLLSVADIGAVTAAHIHKGAAGKNGKPVTPIDVTGPEDDLCIAMEPEKLELIVATPGNYYVNVHTKDFPAGAVRGQLVNESAPEPTEEADPEATVDALPDEASSDAPEVDASAGIPEDASVESPEEASAE